MDIETSVEQAISSVTNMLEATRKAEAFSKAGNVKSALWWSYAAEIWRCHIAWQFSKMADGSWYQIHDRIKVLRHVRDTLTK